MLNAVIGNLHRRNTIMKLRNICKIDIRLGYALRSKVEQVPDGNMLFIQLKDITADGVFNPSDVYRIQKDDYKPDQLIERCDVLFKSRGWHNSAAAVCEELTPAMAAFPLMVIRVDQNKADPRYVAWWINQRPAQKYFEQQATGSSLRLINRNVVAELEIQLPSLKRQKQIAELADLAREEHEKAVRLADLKKLKMDLRLMELAGSALE